MFLIKENCGLKRPRSRTIFFCTVLALLNVVGAQDSVDYTVCNTTVCLKEDEKFWSNLKTDVEPCDDFYDFACGGWIEKHPVPQDFFKISQMSIQDKRATQNLIDILQADPKPSDSEAFKVAKKIYQLCIDHETRKAQGALPLEPLLEKFGGWPITLPSNSWNNDTKWQDVSSIIERLFKGALYRVHTAISDDKDNKTIECRSILVATPYLPLYRRYLLNTGKYNKSLQNFRNTLRNATIALTVNKEWANSTEFWTAVDQDIEDIVNFTIEMAYTFGNDSTEPSLTTIEELQTVYDENNNNSMIDRTQINWLEVIRNVYWKVNVTIDPSEQISLSGWDYFKNLSGLLSRSSVRTIVNYMIWMTIQPQIYYAQESTMDPNRRLESCAKGANLLAAIDYEYTRTYFPDTQKEAARLYINDTVEETVKMVSDVTWMDDITRNAVLDKISTMKVLIGGPDWQNNTTIDEHFSDFLELEQSSTYIGNMINLDIMQWQRHLKRLESRFHDTGKDDPWQTSPVHMNALYLPTLNVLLITAAILENYLFNKDRPDVLNRGLLGWTIAHEIIHGLDRDYFYYDEMSDDNKWTQQSMDAYKNLTQCLIDQYNAYIVPETKDLDKSFYIDGESTLRENIADSGISVAYRVYKNRMQELNEPEVRLPRLVSYNNDQLFFIAAASMHCENFTPENARRRLMDPHATGRARVNGPFSNSDEFAQAFKCSPGSPMNPLNKCRIWT